MSSFSAAFRTTQSTPKVLKPILSETSDLVKLTVLPVGRPHTATRSACALGRFCWTKQQTRSAVDFGGAGTEVQPQPWAEPLFTDLVAVTCDKKCPQGEAL